MNYGYACFVLFLGTATALSWWPVRRTGSLAMVSFQAAVVLNEAPIIGILALGAYTGLAWSQDSLHGATWIFAGLASLIALVLLAILARGINDSRSARRLLTHELNAPLSDLNLVRRALVPMMRRRISVRCTRDVSYGPGGRRHTLDLYMSRSRPAEPAPVFVHFHGGRFRHGRKNTQALSLLYHLASRGWICISANYRLQPHVRYLDQVADVERALDWVRSHASDHGLDPSRIVLSGTSAGAHLAAYVGFDPSQNIAAVVGLGGYYGPADEQHLSPKQRIGPNTPPTLIAHGEDDTLVPIDYVRLFVSALDAGSLSRVIFASLPRAQHAFDFWDSPRFAAVTAGVETFLEQISTPTITGN